MKEQDNFDELFRQKFDEKEFSFSEENWKKMEKKIDAGRGFNNIGWWSKVLIIGLVGGIILSIVFVIMNKENRSESNNKGEKENKSLIVTK